MSKSDDFFDFNHDGKLDALEWSAKMEFLDEVSKDCPEYHRGRSGSRASSSGKVGTGRPSGRSGAGRPAGKPGTARTAGGPGTARPAQGTVQRQAQGTVQRQAQGTVQRPSAGSGASQEEKVEIHPAVWIFLAMVLVFVCVIGGYYVLADIKLGLDRKHEVEKVESRLEEYRALLPEELPKYCEKRGIWLDAAFTAEGAPKMTNSPGSGAEYQFYNVELDYAVTLHAGEAFDLKKDRAKYDQLGVLYRIVGESYDEFMEKSFPDLLELRGAVCQGDASGDTLLGARVCQEIRPRDTRNLRRA